MFELIVKDETGPVRAVFPNQAFLRDVFQSGQMVVLYGTVEFRGSGGLQLTNPEYEVIRGEARRRRCDRPYRPHRPDLREGRVCDAADAAHAGASAAGGDARRTSPDPVPEVDTQTAAPAEPAPALADTHFPPARADVEELNSFRSPAQQRLIFEEFLLFQAGLVLRKRQQAADRKPHPVVVDDRIRESARARYCRSG